MRPTTFNLIILYYMVKTKVLVIKSYVL